MPDFGLGLHFRLASATFGDWHRLYPHYIEQAEVADAYGFDCVTVAEHHFQQDGYIPAPSVVLGAFAARTARLRLAAGVRPLAMVHPIRAAEEIAVLDNLSAGRAVAGGFGLGGRPHEYAGFGIAFAERRARYEESLEIVARTLAEESVDHHGRFYSFAAISLTPRPVQKPRPPIWIAGSAEAAVRRAARLADGWMCKPGESKADLLRLTAIHRQESARHGRVAAGPIIRRDAWVAGSSEQAWDEALPALHFHYTRDYSFIPDDADVGYIREYGRDRFLIGDPEHLVSELRWYRDELGASRVILALDHPGLSAQAVMGALRTIGEAVMPALARA